MIKQQLIHLPTIICLYHVKSNFDLVNNQRQFYALERFVCV